MDKEQIDYIISLLEDNDFQSEYRAFRRAYQRLKIRFRNNQLIGQFKQVVTLIRRLNREFPAQLFKTQRDLVDDKATKAFQSFNNQFIRNIDKILDKSEQLYSAIQPHFNVGHLVQHFIVLRASLARLSICFKALLVFATDLYLETSRLVPIKSVNKRKSPRKKVLTFKEAQEVLLKYDCKPRADLLEESIEVIKEVPSSQTSSQATTKRKKNSNNEEVGQLIDRATMRPMRACKRTKIN